MNDGRTHLLLDLCSSGIEHKKVERKMNYAGVKKLRNNGRVRLAISTLPGRMTRTESSRRAR